MSSQNKSVIEKSSSYGSAVYSDCMKYRYELHRPFKNFFADAGTVNFLMLNPSTATEEQDDPTIRRCIGYAFGWGARKLIITNIFAFRSTDPGALYSNHSERIDSVGADNDAAIKKVALASDLIVCAWGEHGAVENRGNKVLEMLKSWNKTPMCLRKNQSGHPCHPLYLPAGLKPFPF